MYIISTLGLGGAERVVCDLADEMFEKGNEVKVVYFLGEVMTRPANQGIEIVKVSLNNFRQLLPAYIKLAMIIKRYRPNVVHSHMVHTNLNLTIRISICLVLSYLYIIKNNIYVVL